MKIKFRDLKGAFKSALMVHIVVYGMIAYILRYIFFDQGHISDSWMKGSAVAAVGFSLLYSFVSILIFVARKMDGNDQTEEGKSEKKELLSESEKHKINSSLALSVYIATPCIILLFCRLISETMYNCLLEIFGLNTGLTKIVWNCSVIILLCATIGLVIRTIFNIRTIAKKIYPKKIADIVTYQSLFFPIGAIDSVHQIHHYQPDFKDKDINLLEVAVVPGLMHVGTADLIYGKNTWKSRAKILAEHKKLYAYFFALVLAAIVFYGVHDYYRVTVSGYNANMVVSEEFKSAQASYIRLCSENTPIQRQEAKSNLYNSAVNKISNKEAKSLLADAGVELRWEDCDWHVSWSDNVNIGELKKTSRSYTRHLLDFRKRVMTAMALLKPVISGFRQNDNFRLIGVKEFKDKGIMADYLLVESGDHPRNLIYKLYFDINYRLFRYSLIHYNGSIVSFDVKTVDVGGSHFISKIKKQNFFGKTFEMNYSYKHQEEGSRLNSVVGLFYDEDKDLIQDEIIFL